MLDFIVLGLIPGTSAQITFGWLVMCVLMAGLAGLIVYDAVRMGRSTLQKFYMLVGVVLVVSKKKA